jgi:ferritin-like metal-binding protein YciE
VQLARVTVVQQAGEFLALGLPPLHNAQAVEHDELCRYGTLIAWAEELGHDEIVRFLTTNLNEEKAANTKLNTVALRKGVRRLRPRPDRLRLRLSGPGNPRGR